jgi:hypothetical protein
VRGFIFSPHCDEQNFNQVYGTAGGFGFKLSGEILEAEEGNVKQRFPQPRLSIDTEP